MKAIIIAAGFGNRIKKSTNNLPKALLDINGKSILERQIKLFNNYGVDTIFVVVGPYKEKFNLKNVTYVEDNRFNEHEQLGSLMAAKNMISEDVLLAFSDILFDGQIISKIMSSKVDLGIAVYPDWEKLYDGRTEHPKSQADLVEIDHGKILKIKKDLDMNNKHEICEFIGIIKLSSLGSKIWVKKFIELEKTHKGNFHSAISFKRAYLTDMIQELIDSGIDVKPISVQGKWFEIDTPQDLENAKRLFPI